MVYGPIAAFLVELFPTRSATRRCRCRITSATAGSAACCRCSATAMVAADGQHLLRPLVSDHRGCDDARHRTLFLRENKDHRLACRRSARRARNVTDAQLLRAKRPGYRKVTGLFFASAEPGLRQNAGPRQSRSCTGRMPIRRTNRWLKQLGPGSSPAPRTTTRAASPPTRRRARSSASTRLDGRAHLSADGGHPDGQRAHRPRDRARARVQHPPPFSAAGALRDRRAAGRRQHDQHRRRHRRDGRGAAAGRRRTGARATRSCSASCACCCRSSCPTSATSATSSG